MNLWLDDVRPPPGDGWVWVKDAHDALAELRTGSYVMASLDHDLGTDPWTGYWVLCQVEQDLAEGRYRYDPPLITVHSANSGVQIKMRQAIRSITKLYKEGQ